MSKSPIIIIGAGPAGSIVGTLLARAGFATTLIEQHRFPRDKVCGECLSAVGTDVLRRAGAFDLVANLRPVTLNRSLVHAPNGSTIELQLPSPMWGISRRSLDAALLELARCSGVEVRQPARVERVDPHRVIVRNLISNAVEELDSRCTLSADGKGGATHDLGIKAHFTNIHGPRDAIELFGVNGHYGGLAPIENGQWNASFSVPATRVRTFRGDIDALFASIVSENAALRDRMHRARRESEWLASPLPRSFVARSWPENQIPIGNAAASLEPIGGEGMGLAMRSAEIAAKAIIAASRESRAIDIAGLQHAYRSLWRIRSIACRACAMIVSRPALANFIAGAIDGREALPRMMMNSVGKRSGASQLTSP